MISSRSPLLLMSRLIGFITVLVLGGFALASQAGELKFAGAVYHLTTVNVDKDGTVTNDYFLKGEDAKNCSSYLTVRFIPNANTVQDAAAPWLKKIQSLLVRENAVFRGTKAKDQNDIVLEALLAPDDESYLEVDLHRFVIEPGTTGVRAYLFGLRTPTKGGKLNPGPYLAQRKLYFEGVSELTVEAVKEKR